jgi:hypothetical protein
MEVFTMSIIPDSAQSRMKGSTPVVLIPSNDGNYFDPYNDANMELFLGKIAKKIANKLMDKRIEDANHPPEVEAKVKAEARTAVNLVTEKFKDDLASAPKVLLAAVVGLAKGGPLGMITAGMAVSAEESKKNQAAFVKEVVKKGIPITVDGEFIPGSNIDWSVIPGKDLGPVTDSSTEGEISPVMMIGAFALVFLLVILILFLL